MIRLAVSLVAAVLVTAGGWSALGTAVAPSHPQLRVIAHVYAHARHEGVSAARPAGDRNQLFI